eukprot:9469022-Heterocapsa_arctica.AAC.1
MCIRDSKSVDSSRKTLAFKLSDEIFEVESRELREGTPYWLRPSSGPWSGVQTPPAAPPDS